MSTYRVSQLAERTGVPATTLRYYESAGLLPAERSPAGYRLYGEPAVRRLEFIATAKRLGLALDEIAELLRVWETGACAEVKTDLRPRLSARLTEAERRRREVDEFIASLHAALAHLDALPDRAGRCDADCGFLTLPADDGPTRWRDAPVACSLSPDDVAERTDRWRGVLADSRHRPVPEGVELTLPIERVAEVAELAAAEQACCPFLDFTVHLDGPHLRLRVRAAAEGQEVLAGLFGRSGTLDRAG